MSTLFIIPPKTLSQTPISEWNSIMSNDDVLFTSQSNEYAVDEIFLNKINCSAHIFINLNSSGLIEKKAMELHNQKKFNKIISTSEVDVLRCAKLRECLNISGQKLSSALLYRDKTMMKDHLCNQGIKVPRYQKIHYASDLINFISDVGYNVVVKPNLGAGSASTVIIKDDNQLNSLLSHGLIDSSYGTPDLIAESFVKGRMYHVDGLVLSNELVINQPSAYFNSCVEFQGGVHLGSYMLDEKNPLTERLRDLNKKVISLLGGYINFAFHAEYFQDDMDQLIFCEIACRPGGGAIKDAIFDRYGVNLVTEWMRCELQRDYQIPAVKASKNLSGFLLVPPSSGILKHIPNTMPFEWIKKYHVTASLDSQYNGNARTSGEIVNILIEGSCESDLLERINIASTWLNENIQWA